MLLASLERCTPTERQVQEWFIERKQFDFVLYNRVKSDVTLLTTDMLSKLESGSTIIMRVIIEEVIDPTVTATYKCPCGTPNTIDVNIKDLAATLQRGCTITW